MEKFQVNVHACTCNLSILLLYTVMSIFSSKHYFSPPQSNLSGHLSLLEGALGHVSGLKDRLMELLLQLEDWRSKLKGHEPPHVLPVDVEKQLQQLAVSAGCIVCMVSQSQHLYCILASEITYMEYVCCTLWRNMYV